MTKQLCSLFMLGGFFIGNAYANEGYEKSEAQLKQCVIFLSLSLTDTTCGEQNGQIVIEQVEGTGRPPIIFTLSRQGPNQNLVFPGENTFSNLSADEYTLFGIDAEGGEFSVSSSLVIAPSTGITINDIQLTTPTCKGDNNGEITVPASAEATPITFKLNGQVQEADSMATFSGLGGGMYTAMVTDANGCTDMQMVNLMAPDNVAVDLVVDDTTRGANGSVNVIAVSGGTPPYVGRLVNSSGEEMSIDVPGNFGIVRAGDYVLSITDANTCATNRVFSIATSTGVAITNVSTQNPTCNGVKDGSITLTAETDNPHYMLYFNNAIKATNTTGMFDGLGAGTYEIVVTDSTGCTAFVLVTLTEPDALLFKLQTTDNAEDTGSLIITKVRGGTPPYEFSIGGDFQSSPSFTGLAPGTYVVTVKDSNNCSAQKNATIKQSADVLVESRTCSTISDGSRAVRFCGTPKAK